MKTILMFGFVAGAVAMDCSAGNKHKSSLTGLKCTSSVLSAASCTGCCVDDPLKCGGNTFTCASGKYRMDMGLSGTALANAANTATTAATAATDCCLEKATCASTAYTCPAGMKKATANAANKCNGGASTCATSTGCCEPDTATCAGVGLVAADCTASSKYFPSVGERVDAWSSKAATTANKAAECCLTKAKCSDATCPAGYKKKDNVATTECSGNAASCSTGTTCCEKDVLKCGGLNAPTCATGMYVGTNDAWKNTAATDTNKNTNCCMAKAKCSTYTCPAGYNAKSAAATTDCATVATASCATGTCCDMITAATCDAFKAQVATSTQTSSGTYQLCPALTMAMGVIAFLSMK